MGKLSDRGQFLFVLETTLLEREFRHTIVLRKRDHGSLPIYRSRNIRRTCPPWYKCIYLVALDSEAPVES